MIIFNPYHFFTFAITYIKIIYFYVNLVFCAYQQMTFIDSTSIKLKVMPIIKEPENKRTLGPFYHKKYF